jgi:hypothetical protein
MPERLSANSLFHFTNNLENLLSILRNEFWPSYNLERLFNGQLEIGVPMVCFCDIPLSQVKNHSKYYGEYAIGMKKNWGTKNKINPVFYLCENTAPSNHLQNLLMFTVKLKRHKNNGYEIISKYIRQFFEIVSFLKP